MKTIEIHTSHNVMIEYELASLGTRLGALIIDVVILFFYYLIIAIAGIRVAIQDDNFVFIVIMTIPLLTYSLWTEFFFNGQTIGKMALGIRVVNVDGQAATLGNYFMRWAMKLIDVWFSGGGLGAIFITSSFRSQRTGDIIAGTAVIRNRPSNSYSINDILKIKSKGEHEPQYLNVVQFTDEDMILIKSALTRLNRYPNKAHKEMVKKLFQKCVDKLNLEEPPKDKIKFLNALLQDYIVLTR
ncbi:MAG: RDD family protein [Crocinitomicaceae bacterium]|nr:RDD family protein [Crocinitomicaceae bacterium]